VPSQHSLWPLLRPDRGLAFRPFAIESGLVGPHPFTHAPPPDSDHCLLLGHSITCQEAAFPGRRHWGFVCRDSLFLGVTDLITTQTNASHHQNPTEIRQPFPHQRFHRLNTTQQRQESAEPTATGTYICFAALPPSFLTLNFNKPLLNSRCLSSYSQPPTLSSHTATRLTSASPSCPRQ